MSDQPNHGDVNAIHVLLDLDDIHALAQGKPLSRVAQERAATALSMINARYFDIVAHAKDMLFSFHNDFEIDDTPLLSEGEDNGVFVMCWFWVDFSDTPFDKEKEKDDG